jgi:outer membrane protein assembly factor BamE (lipoprotein component of BamABCDE complex)
MTKKRKAFAILISSALFTSAARFSYSYLQFHAVGSRFHRVKIGETRQQVRNILGKPNYHDGPCNDDILAPPKGCEWEYVYSFPLAPLVPEYYVVSFSKEDRVIRAVHTTSP